MTTSEIPRSAPGRRAERRGRTRQRILEATVDLHTTIGPGRTTISAIAERAGVQRHTVYAHFPDERDLFQGCTALWQSRNPFPDPGRWAAVEHPPERLAVALDELYDFYDRSGEDLLAIFAGAEDVPAMAESIARRAGTMSALAELLARGRGVRGRRRARLLAAIGHALSLTTWHSLVVEGGLTRTEAVRLMAALADEACAPRS
jgi:AcrR family transcriptional regulator